MKITYDFESMIKLFEKVVDGIVEGNSYSSMLKRHHIHPLKFEAFLQDNPECQAMHQTALEFYSQLIVDKAKEDAEDESLTDKRAALRVAVSQWQAAKFSPKRFGDSLNLKVEQQVSVLDALNAAQERVSRDQSPHSLNNTDLISHSNDNAPHPSIILDESDNFCHLEKRQKSSTPPDQED